MYQQKDDLFSLGIFCIFIIFQTNCGMYIWTGDRKSYTIHKYITWLSGVLLYKVLKICMEGGTGEALKPILHLISCHGTFQTVKF